MFHGQKLLQRQDKHPGQQLYVHYSFHYKYSRIFDCRRDSGSGDSDWRSGYSFGVFVLILEGKFMDTLKSCLKHGIFSWLEILITIDLQLARNHDTRFYDLIEYIL